MPGSGDTTNIRFTIAAARRILYREGCDSTIGGHVSARAGDDSFWVTPFEYFDETTPERVVEVGFDLRIREGESSVSPAVEFHVGIYRARPDVGAIVHTHSHYVSVFSTMGTPVGMWNPSSTLFLDDQALYADDESQPVDAERSSTMAAALGSRNVLIFENHGAVVVAPTVEQATIKALVLEQAARYHLEAHALPGAREIGEAQARRGQAAYHRYYLPQMWAANLRRLRRSDPDLFAGVQA